MNTQLMQKYWFKRLFLLHWIGFVPSMKVHHLFMFISKLSLLLHLSFISANTFTCWLMCFYNKSWNQSHILQLSSSFSKLFWLFLSICLSIWILELTLESDFYFTKTFTKILIGIVFNLQFRKKYWVTHSSSTPSPHVRIQARKRVLTRNQISWQPDHGTSQPPKWWEINFYYLSHLVYRILVCKPKQTNNTWHSVLYFIHLPRVILKLPAMINNLTINIFMYKDLTVFLNIS